MITLPAMPSAQTNGWHALLDVAELIPTGWAVVGGQMVTVLCAERGQSPPRATDDVDTILDVRAAPGIHHQFTSALKGLGFELAGTSANDKQHRWVRQDAQIDVLIPRHLGERAALRKGAGGAPTIETPGAQYVLNRSSSAQVNVDGRIGTINRPTLVGGLIAKAAACTVALDTNRQRHIADCITLASLLRANDDFTNLLTGEHNYLTNMLGTSRSASTDHELPTSLVALQQRLAAPLRPTRESTNAPTVPQTFPGKERTRQNQTSVEGAPQTFRPTQSGPDWS